VYGFVALRFVFSCYVEDLVAQLIVPVHIECISSTYYKSIENYYFKYFLEDMLLLLHIIVTGYVFAEIVGRNSKFCTFASFVTAYLHIMFVCGVYNWFTVEKMYLSSLVHRLSSSDLSETNFSQDVYTIIHTAKKNNTNKSCVASEDLL
jgi:hypothetical protein